jgi:2'-5' RNA ligase
MRLFVAVEIDDRARQVAEAVQERLQGTLNSILKARWVPAENMHLTVRFIGPVDDDCVPTLIEALTPPLDIPPFDVVLGGCGVFPRSGPPRAVWIGLLQGLSALASMHATFNRRLIPFGVEPERRPYSAHLTLARIKESSKGAGRALRDTLENVPVPSTRSRVNRATLFQSHMSPKGPRYEPLAFIPLNGQP